MNENSATLITSRLSETKDLETRMPNIGDLLFVHHDYQCESSIYGSAAVMMMPLFDENGSIKPFMMM